MAEYLPSGYLVGVQYLTQVLTGCALGWLQTAVREQARQTVYILMIQQNLRPRCTNMDHMAQYLKRENP